MANGALYMFGCMICMIYRVMATFVGNMFKIISATTIMSNRRKQVKPLKRPLCPQTTELPEGWRKVEKIRKNGESKGKKDIYLYSPTGYKFSSNKNVQLYMRLQKQKVYMPNVFSKYYGVQKDSGNAKKD